MVCAVDNSYHETREDLHKHLRKLKVKQEDYYTQYLPRKDRFTGELIPFKSVDQYLTTEFLSRENLREWIKANPVHGREWSIQWLEKRKAEKNLVYPPTQTELRSLLAPSIHYFDREGGYNDICKSLGFKIRFPDRWADGAYIPGMVVIEDSREQRPLDIAGIPTVERKLNCGDYGLEYPFDQGVYVERKSLSDFIGTMSDRVIERKSGDDSNLARFTRELERAKECGHYIVMLVEDTIEHALGFRELREYKFSKISPEHIFHNLRGLLTEHENFQVIFVDGREAAARAVIKILLAGESVRKMDLQYELESGRFKP